MSSTLCPTDCNDTSEVAQCDSNRRQKSFVEALTRMANKSHITKDGKTYERQLKKNEALKDLITRQKGISAGVTLEAQNL